MVLMALDAVAAETVALAMRPAVKSTNGFWKNRALSLSPSIQGVAANLLPG